MNSFRVVVTALLILSAAIGVAPQQADAVALSTLIDTNGTITQGDKLFSNFTATITTASGNVSPTSLSGIDVTGTTVGGLFGLQFGGGLNAIAPTNPSSANLDILISYTVTVLSPGIQISDIHLDFNGNCTVLIAGGVCSTNVTETVRNAAGSIIGSATVTALDLDQNIDLSQLVSTARVTKDINLLALNGAAANISFVDQVFSQTVPEPGSLMLLGVGLSGLGIWGRRRARKSS